MKTKSNKAEDIIDYISSELKSKYSQNEIRILTNILFFHYAGINSAHLMAFKDEPVNESSLLNIVLATQRLKKQEPIQYILGFTEFCSLNFEVTPDVLIPRPETEEMVLQIIKQNTLSGNSNNGKNLKIIDLCTGSGCIAVSLSKYIKNSEVFAMDISQKALEVAEKNNERLDTDVIFFEGDLLQYGLNTAKQDNDEIKRRFISAKRHFIETKSHFSKMKRPFNNLTDEFDKNSFDIIVSNPPYVTEKEKSMMKNNVLNYEPALSLFVKDGNPLVFYESIEVFARKNLKKGGKIYLEINENLANQTSALFSNKEYITEVRKDITGRDRFVFLQKIN